MVIRDNMGSLTRYSENPMYAFSESYLNLVNQVYDGSTISFYEDPVRAVNNRSAKQALEEFFLSESYDVNDPSMTPEAVQEHEEDMRQLFENDCKAVLEHTNPASIAPMIGMAFPMHKFIMMNMVFDKGSIPKFVAEKPKFTYDTEYRVLVDTQGNELDFFRDQNKLTAAIDATAALTYFDMTLPMGEDVEIVHDKLGGLAHADHLSIETSLYAFKVPGVYIRPGELLPNENGYVERGNEVATEGTTADIWVKLDYPFLPGYGRNTERTLTRHVVFEYYTAEDSEKTVINETFTGTMRNDRLQISTISGRSYEVRIKSRLDTSNARATTCSVRWKHDTEMVEIPNAIPINTTVSPDEVRDISLLYNVNQVTKIMSLTKTVMANYKDDKILEKLNESWSRMDDTNSEYDAFDFCPREGYALDHVEWRYKVFQDFFQSFVQKLLQKYNDPNVTIAIYGDPDTVAKITPDSQNVTYQSPASIGPVELDFTKTVVNARRHVYTFIGSDKLRGSDEFIVVVNPRGSDKIMYRIYDYQLYISNEIRNADNPSLPAIHSFERWHFVEHMPVQGRVKLLNPSGINKERYDFVQVRNV